ncbi:very short patch repair endonuclease [Sinomonas sp. RB5]
MSQPGFPEETHDAGDAPAAGASPASSASGGTRRSRKGEPSWATTPAIRRTMLGNRSRDTAPELKVRRAVHAMGLRYRVAYRPVPALRRTADLVFTRARVAVFIDGCYWHGCPQHYIEPASNVDYWRPKIARNRERDAETTAALSAAGWQVLRFWSHEDPARVAAEIAEAVRPAGAGPAGPGPAGAAGSA